MLHTSVFTATGIIGAPQRRASFTPIELKAVRSKQELRVPDEYQVEAMIAIGRHGKKEDLPDYLQEREFPSPRKNVSEIALEGMFL